VRVQIVDITEPATLDSAFAMIIKERPDALMVLADPMLAGQRPRILRRVDKVSRPSMLRVHGFRMADS
jgi:hypothetical protein